MSAAATRAAGRVGRSAGVRHIRIVEGALQRLGEKDVVPDAIKSVAGAARRGQAVVVDVVHYHYPFLFQFEHGLQDSGERGALC
jgi:hypothetical protein